MGMWDLPTDAYPAGAKPDIPCPKATNFDSCIKNCDCEWGKSKNKCNASVPCLDIAKAEHDACTGKCLTDYS
jgi:hypothetical protein